MKNEYYRTLPVPQIKTAWIGAGVDGHALRCTTSKPSAARARTSFGSRSARCAR